MFFPPRDGKPSGCHRQEDEGHGDPVGAHSLKEVGRDCSPSSAGCHRATPASSNPQLLGRSKVPVEQHRWNLICHHNLPGPDLTEDGFPSSASHLSLEQPGELGGGGHIDHPDGKIRSSAFQPGKGQTSQISQQSPCYSPRKEERGLPPQ